RQVVVGLSSQAYTASSAGGSYSSGGTSYTGNPYLWDGGAIGLDAAKARLNLGLQDVSNLGTGEVSTEEFNYLDGVTSNIQTQLNSKENVLTFVGPLVRSGQQISFNYNSTNLRVNGGALDTIQDIHTSANVQFGAVNAGNADIVDSLNMSSSLFADSARNVYAGRIGVGGDPDFAAYVFKAYGSGHFTGNLLVNGPARVERLGLGTDADASLSLKTAAGAYINGNLTVVGNIYQSGTAYLVDAQHLQVESNIIYVNKNEAGNGVTNGIAGIEVERGTGTNYQFMFQESDDTFRLGMAGSLQAAATRQDSPISQGVAYWNNTVYRFDTSSNLKFDGTHLAIGGAALTDALNVRGNILQDINYKYSSLGYFSGWGNKGFELNTDASGVSNLIVDNLTVRRTMSVYELLIRQIRATNGNLFVTADAKVEISGYGSNSSSEKSFLQFEDATGHNLGVFKYNDILLVQKLELDGSANLKYVFARVNADYITQSSWASFFTDNATKKRRYVVSYSLDGVAWNYNQTIGQWFEAGDSVVRIGNFTDTARQGSIYLASDDDGAPF
ncbi:MAG TPA: hypothetical protein VHP30_08650, partial [Ignavibacteriales bacterium]|nr:hypothetical protein [Ignavibacteriales bacterium]